MTGKLLIRNVWLADGSGSPMRKGACLTAHDGTIAAVEKEFSGSCAEEVLDGQGLILAPGFIDAHGHSDLSALSAPECFSKVSQGVTAEVTGNCGLSPFPVTPENKEHLEILYHDYGFPLTWEKYGDYMETCRNVSCRLSLVPLVGHNTLRAAVRGYDKGACSGRELENMCYLLDRELCAGAAGLSFGLLYTPGIFAQEDEIAALMKVAAGKNKVCTAHLRSEGDGLLESVSEMIALAREAGLKHFHVSHLKTAGAANHSKLDKVLELFEEARQQGIEITCDRYPYIESMTQLSVALPGAWKELDDEALKKKLRSTEEQRQLITDLRSAKDAEYWERCRLVNTRHPQFVSFKGRKITAIPGDVVENVVEMLSFDPVACQAAFAGMSEENMKRIIKLPFCVAGSDGNALPGDGRFGSCHPRSFGAIARFLRLCLDEGVSIEESVSKATQKSCDIFGLADRGVLLPGKKGDLVLFDPDTIDSKADFISPETPAEGIVCVIKNSEVIYN